jgi:Ca2+-binding EF-hand superfamily protein
LWNTFAAIDINNDRTISFSEFIEATEVLTQQGIDMTEPVRQWNEVDSDSSGSVSFSEFCSWALDKNKDKDLIINIEDDISDNE